MDIQQAKKIVDAHSNNWELLKDIEKVTNKMVEYVKESKLNYIKRKIELIFDKQFEGHSHFDTIMLYGYNDLHDKLFEYTKESVSEKTLKKVIKELVKEEKVTRTYCRDDEENTISGSGFCSVKFNLKGLNHERR